MQVAIAAQSIKSTAETDVKQSQFVCDTETGRLYDTVSSNDRDDRAMTMLSFGQVSGDVSSMNFVKSIRE